MIQNFVSPKRKTSLFLYHFLKFLKRRQFFHIFRGNARILQHWKIARKIQRPNCWWKIIINEKCSIKYFYWSDHHQIYCMPKNSSWMNDLNHSSAINTMWIFSLKLEYPLLYALLIGAPGTCGSNLSSVTNLISAILSL